MNKRILFLNKIIPNFKICTIFNNRIKNYFSYVLIKEINNMEDLNVITKELNFLVEADRKSEEGSYQDAIRDLNALIYICSNDYSRHYENGLRLRAICKKGIQDYQGAIQDYDALIKFNTHEGKYFFFTR